MIIPSASELGCGSAIAGMMNGLIPVVTPSTDVDVKDIGFSHYQRVRRGDQGGCRSVNAQPDATLLEMSRGAWEAVNVRYGRERFLRAYRDAVCRALGTARSPRWEESPVAPLRIPRIRRYTRVELRHRRANGACSDRDSPVVAELLRERRGRPFQQPTFEPVHVCSFDPRAAHLLVEHRPIETQARDKLRSDRSASGPSEDPRSERSARPAPFASRRYPSVSRRQCAPNSVGVNTGRSGQSSYQLRPAFA